MIDHAEAERLLYKSFVDAKDRAALREYIAGLERALSWSDDVTDALKTENDKLTAALAARVRELERMLDRQTQWLTRHIAKLDQALKLQEEGATHE